MEARGILSNTVSSDRFPLSDPTLGNHRIRRSRTSCRIPLPKIPTTSDRILVEVVGCLSEVIGLARIHRRIRWDPRVEFIVLGKIYLPTDKRAERENVRRSMYMFTCPSCVLSERSYKFFVFWIMLFIVTLGSADNECDEVHSCSLT
jgi:hypothetical protein